MQVKALSGKAEALCENDSGKTALWSDKLKFEILFGNHGTTSAGLKRRDHPTCYRHSVKNPASLVVWHFGSAHGTGNIYIWKGTMSAERFIQVLVFSGKTLHISARQCKTTYCIYYYSM